MRRGTANTLGLPLPYITHPLALEQALLREWAAVEALAAGNGPEAAGGTDHELRLNS